MNKKLTFLLSLTFLFLFSGSVYGEEPEIKREYWGKGKLYKEIYFKNKKREGLTTWWYASGVNNYEVLFKNGKKEKLETTWYKNGRKKLFQRYKNGHLEGMKTEWHESGKRNLPVTTKTE
jgi:antitoxin component YwqK of YwqJK toxin-antitoxin module